MSLRQFQNISRQALRCYSIRRTLGPALELSQGQRQGLRLCTVLLPVSCAATSATSASAVAQYSTAAAVSTAELIVD